jgi:hypothetical protein
VGMRLQLRSARTCRVAACHAHVGLGRTPVCCEGASCRADTAQHYFYIPVILGSTRRGRQRPKVARFIAERMRRSARIDTEILDLLADNFPVMAERLHFRDDPPPGLREFSEKVARSDALVIVTPEYNNGDPGGLKNALDYLLPEYQ